MRSPSNFSRYAPQPATTCRPVRRATSARRSGLRPIAALDVASTIVRPPSAAKLSSSAATAATGLSAMLSAQQYGSWRSAHATDAETGTSTTASEKR
ncbi:Uncharacterised protein [Mycobacteroides abscessus]|nr:Uncharacterised protein [Mycobacteroides abscessus]